MFTSHSLNRGNPRMTECGRHEPRQLSIGRDRPRNRTGQHSRGAPNGFAAREEPSSLYQPGTAWSLLMFHDSPKPNFCSCGLRWPRILPRSRLMARETSSRLMVRASLPSPAAQRNFQNALKCICSGPARYFGIHPANQSRSEGEIITVTIPCQ